MFRNILVPLDGSDLAEEAIGMAAAIARASNATLDLLMVHEPAFAMHDDSWNERQIVAEQVQNLGFPPVLLDPIDFAAAYLAQVESSQGDLGGVPEVEAGNA